MTRLFSFIAAALCFLAFWPLARDAVALTSSMDAFASAGCLVAGFVLVLIALFPKAVRA